MKLHHKWLTTIATLILRTCIFSPSGALAQPAWIQPNPTGGPPPTRGGPAAIFDSASNRMTIFGGAIPNGDLSDMWMLTNADGLGGSPAWTQLTPSGGSPGGRFAPATAYDSANNVMILFGGDPHTGSCSAAANDVWTLSNANALNGTPTWTQLFPTSGPPGARRWSATGYDQANNRLMIFGGDNPCRTPVFGDVWVLTNANGLSGTPSWVQLSPTGTPPVGRTAAVGAYNEKDNALIVFGGTDVVSQNFNDVWVLSNANGLGGTPSWTELFPNGGPPAPRNGPAGVYDPSTNRLTIFSGGIAGTQASDVWVLSNADGQGGTPTWTQLAPTGGPPEPRNAAVAIYNPTSDRMTIFSGDSTVGGSFLNDTWVLTEANGLPPDITPPTIAITSPTSTTYTLNQAEPCAYSCSDSDDTVTVCAGPVASGADIDTASVGAKPSL